MCGWRSWIGMLALCVLGCEAPGQRLLHVQVVFEGRALLETQFGQSDAATRTEAWRALAGRELEPVNPSSDEIPADAQDPLHAVLRGTVRIVIRHADSPYADAQLQDLKLERDSPASQLWRISKEELRRAAPF